jgi:chromosome segregation ATPase
VARPRKKIVSELKNEISNEFITQEINSLDIKYFKLMKSNEEQLADLKIEVINKIHDQNEKLMDVDNCLHEFNKSHLDLSEQVEKLNVENDFFKKNLNEIENKLEYLNSSFNIKNESNQDFLEEKFNFLKERYESLFSDCENDRKYILISFFLSVGLLFISILKIIF